MSADGAPKSERRKELAEFLRARRAGLRPADVGLPASARRRTPGLRREEVAELAGVGATWYTWLEQARDIQPSEVVLERLARALRLSGAELEHLYALAGKPIPRRRPPESEETAPPTLLRLIEASISCPAVLLGRRWDILAANALARRRFPGIAELSPDHFNWMYLVFCGPFVKARLVDWERNARRVLAEFRLSVADALDAPWVAEMVADLSAKSPEFALWWGEHDVRDLSTAEFRLRSEAGDSDASEAVERLVFFPADGDGLRLVLYPPRAP